MNSSEPSDEFTPNESKTYLITAFLPNGNIMKVTINGNLVEINKRIIKGIKEEETSSGSLVYKGTDVETGAPITLNKRLILGYEEVTKSSPLNNLFKCELIIFTQ